MADPPVLRVLRAFAPTATEFDPEVLAAKAKEAGDVVDVRVRTKLEGGGDYKTMWEKSYSGVQPDDRKVIKLSAMPDNYGLEVSMRQTAGTLKYILCEFFDAKR